MTVDSAKASRKTNFALKSFHKKCKQYYSENDKKIIYIFYIFYYYDTFHELHKHRFVMQRLQNPPLCGSTLKSKQLKTKISTHKLGWWKSKQKKPEGVWYTSKKRIFKTLNSGEKNCPHQDGNECGAIFRRHIPYTSPHFSLLLSFSATALATTMVVLHSGGQRYSKMYRLKRYRYTIFEKKIE